MHPQKILIMKRFIPILFCCLIALSSCKKSGVKLFVGDYSFKTSGEVTITAQAIINDDNITIPAEMNVDLLSDIGQLNISVSDKENQEVLVVINYVNGDVITTYGTCYENIIQLDEFQRNTLPITINSLLLPNNTYITVSGRGEMYDNGIVFDLTIKGRTIIGPFTYKIRDKNVQMVAYRNW